MATINERHADNRTKMALRFVRFFREQGKAEVPAMLAAMTASDVKEQMLIAEETWIAATAAAGESHLPSAKTREMVVQFINAGVHIRRPEDLW